jgi:hypothetical protein
MNDFELFSSLYEYDPESGVLLRRKTGKPVKAKNGAGYIKLQVNRRQYTAHRVAWLLSTGAWPQHDIDHINGDREDNRFNNLRDVPRSVNLQNRVKSGGRTGFLGVSLHAQTGRYSAQIRANGRNKSLGLFDTPEEAHKVYIAAKRQLHQGFVEGRGSG